MTSEEQKYLQEYLLESMTLMAKNAIAEASFTSIKEAEIVEIIDEALGRYLVRYLDNEITAYSAYTNLVYQVGNKVKLLITNDKIDEDKIILGLANPSSASYITNVATDDYLVLSDNLFSGISDVINLSSYYYREKGEPSPHNEVDCSNVISNNFNQIFSQYLDDYTTDEASATFSLEVLIKTTIDKMQFSSNGDFGLCFEVPVITVDINGNKLQETTHKFFLNCQNMKGNPYSYHDYVYRNTIISLDLYEKLDTSRKCKAYLYVDKNFIQKEQITEEDYDIFIKEINLKAVEMYSKNVGNYTLGITATDGPYFSTGYSQSEKVLKPVLRIDGKLTSVEDYDCYWFREDSNIKKTTDEGYNALGGIGWRCLNQSTLNQEGQEVLKTDDRTLSVFSNDIVTSCRYKCVLNLDTTSLYSIITISNLDSKIKINLERTPDMVFPNSGNVTFTCRVDYPNLPSNTNLKFEWMRYDFRGNYISNLNGTISEIKRENVLYKNIFELDTAEINVVNTVTCSVYSVDIEGTSTLLGTVQDNVALAAAAQLDFSLLLENADILYKYDSDGHSPFVANYNGPAGSIEKTTKPIGFRIIKKNGEEFTEDEYGVCKVTWTVPKQSMFIINKDLTYTEDDNNYYITSASLPYEIKSLYDPKLVDAKIDLSVEFQGNVLISKPNIIFTKEGANGTNGSKYTAFITYDGYEYNEFDSEHNLNRKLKFVWISNQKEEGESVGEWYWHDQVNKRIVPIADIESPFELDVKIYNGSKVQDNIQGDITWSIFDSSSTTNCCTISKQNGKGVLSFNKDWTKREAVYCNTVEAKVKVGNDGITNTEEYIYAYYPIEITRLQYEDGVTIESRDSIIPEMSGGFYEVDYYEDGTNPQYVHENFSYNSEVIDKSGYTGYYAFNWSSSENLTTKDRTSRICTFEPVTRFDNGISKNYVKVESVPTKEYEPAEKERIINELDIEIAKYQSYIAQVNFYKNNLSSWISTSNPILKNRILENLKGSVNYLNIRTDTLTPLMKGVKEYLYVTVRKELFVNKNKYYTNPATAYVPEDFAEAYITAKIQPYINKVFDFDLSRTYSEYITGEFIIDVTTLFSIDIEPEITSLLNEAGLSYMEQVKNQIRIQVDNYNDTVLKFIREGEDNKYYYCDSYVCFAGTEKLLPTLEVLYNQYNLTNLYNMVILDTTLAEQDQFVSYDKYTKTCYLTFEDIVKAYVDSRNSVTNTDLFSLEYFNDKVNNVIIGNYENFASLNEEGNYVIKKSVEEELQNKVKEYNDKLSGVTSQRSAIVTIFDGNSTNVIHIKPIVMLTNRYGNTYINGWDGNKLYIDEENEQYLFAPQVGAGTKEDGKFTGMLMGVRGYSRNNKTDIGLFGYNEGLQSIFLDSKTGAATFGISGSGQIIIDPSQRDAETGKPKATISSGNYVPKSETEQGSGMEIDLTKPAINFGTGNFSVTPDGSLTAKGRGSIGGWVIDTSPVVSPIGERVNSSVLHSPTTDRVILETYTEQGNVADTIYLDSNAKYDEETQQWIEADENRTPAIYTGNHTSIDKTEKGFFLDGTGMSIHNFFRVRKEGRKIKCLDCDYEGITYNDNVCPKCGSDNIQILYEETPGINGVEIGDLANNSLGKPGQFWTISGAKEEKTPDGFTTIRPARSYIGYNTNVFIEGDESAHDILTYLDGISTEGRYEFSGEENENKVYIGTDGISIGDSNGGNKNFWVSSNGVLYANKGVLGGWILTDNRLLGGSTIPIQEYSPRMDLNAEKGYLSYINTPLLANEYGTAETPYDMLNPNPNESVTGFILNSDGLYFGNWKSYLDNKDGYFHCQYGDLGGFHVGDSEMEAGKLPYGLRNESVVKDNARAIVTSDTPRTIEGLRDQEYKPYSCIYVQVTPTGNENPSNLQWYEKINNEYYQKTTDTEVVAGKTYYREEHNQEYDKYMKLSTYDACLTFNTTDWSRTIAQGSGVYIGRDGIALGSTFNVDSNGVLTATEGHIAGWNIEYDTLAHLNTSLGTAININSNGSICGGEVYYDENEGIWQYYGIGDINHSYWEINESGQASFNNVNIIGGEINMNNGEVIINPSDGLTMAKGSIELGYYEQSGVYEGPAFRVTSDGQVICAKMNIVGGSISLKDINQNYWSEIDISSNGFYSLYEDFSGHAGRIYMHSGLIIIDGPEYSKEFGIKSGNYSKKNNTGFYINGQGVARFSDLYVGGVHYKSSDNSITYGEGMNIKFTTPMNIGDWAIGTDSFANSGGSITCKSLTVNGKSLTNYIKDVVTEAYLKGKLDSVYAAKNHQHTIPAENVYNGQTWVGATTGGTTT